MLDRVRTHVVFAPILAAKSLHSTKERELAFKRRGTRYTFCTFVVSMILSLFVDVAINGI